MTRLGGRLAAALTAATALLAAAPARSDDLPVVPDQKSTVEQVAQTGVPLDELAPGAPERHTVQRGDTLWGVAGLFLKTPWRWPELWGMNRQGVSSPHRIYPGQQLYLERLHGRAVLRADPASGTEADATGMTTVRLSPNIRYQSLAEEGALPTLKPHLIEPFLAEPIIVDEATFAQAPRIVAARDARVLFGFGDRVYARGPASAPLLAGPGQQSEFRVFRSATPLRDSETGAILGYQAQYVGGARLVRGEVQGAGAEGGQPGRLAMPATIDIVRAKEEMRVGDRLLPEPMRSFMSYTPRAPRQPVQGRIVSVYGSAVTNAAQNQVVVINRGSRDGVEAGQVLAILVAGARITDPTDPRRQPIQLPDERNGLLMVFRPFENLSYALVLDITDGVKVGDRVTNPR